MSGSIVKRRLKTLEQVRAERLARAEAAKERKSERDLAREIDELEARQHGITVFMLAATRRAPLVLPMRAYYGREPEHEALRARFYADIALIFSSAGWNLPPAHKAALPGPGFDERREVRPIDRGSTVHLNLAAAPLEWLAAKGRLETRADAAGQRMVRFAVASKFRDIAAGAEYSGLKGQAYDGGGGSGGSGRLVSDHMLDCIKLLSRIRAAMAPDLFDLLTAVVCRDEWVWEKVPAGKRRRMLIASHRRAVSAGARAALEKKIAKAIEQDQWPVIGNLHKAIDKAAVTLGYMAPGEFKRRWGSFTPLWTAPKRRPRKAPSGPQPAR